MKAMDISVPARSRPSCYCNCDVNLMFARQQRQNHRSPSTPMIDEVLQS